LFNKIIIKA